MISKTTREFREQYRALPPHVRRHARAAFRLWLGNPQHPGLQFKRLNSTLDLYSARVGLSWRVLGRRVDNCIVWFWIGSHAEYDRLLRS